MISINLIRSEPDRVRRAMELRCEEVPIDRIIELDIRRRVIITEADTLRAQRNEVSRELGQSEERPHELIEEMRRVGTRIKELEEEIRTIDKELTTHLVSIPNIPDEQVPVGENEAANVVVRSTEELPSFNFEPMPHWSLGEKLDIIDFRRGASLSGSRFYVLKEKGAKLQRAIIAWMLDLHIEEHGYRELYLPLLVSRDTATGSGHLPKFEDTMYHDDQDDLWLLPTAEVAITNMHRDEILAPDQLPINYVAHTPCFRREKAAAGRDTRGIKRVHQFEKVEMYKFVEPQESDQALDKLVTDAEDICVRLGVPYRVVQLCTGELGFASVKSYDIEMWAPGSREWLEVSSCSNCTDFQARRANVRYKPKSGSRTQFTHTLNGSGLALPRVMIALMENYQQPDGSIIIPETLRPYTGFDLIP